MGRESGSDGPRARSGGVPPGGRRRVAGEGRRVPPGADTAGAPRKERARSSDVRDDPAAPPRRRAWVADGDLPRWIQDEVARVTAKARIPATLELLQSAARSFVAGRYGKALRDAEQAKELSPRDATIRELLGLSAYRLGRWELALRELRTFRRLAGDTTHMPVEMDVLRALERPDAVEDAWATFRRLGGDRFTDLEARVVYGSFLLDRGDARKSWQITGPKRLVNDPSESDLRVWYVASRAAARLGDEATARRLFEAIQTADPAFPGLDELEATVSGA